MSEILTISRAIQDKVASLENGRKLLMKYAKEKAAAIREYDEVMAHTIIAMKKDHPASLCKELAKGACAAKREQMEVAIESYKIVNTTLDCIKAELNGLQSVNRHLSE